MKTTDFRQRRRRAASFSLYFTELLMKYDLSTADFSKRTGINKSYVGHLKNNYGETLPRIRLINQIAQGFGIKPYKMYRIAGVKLPGLSDILDMKPTWNGKPISKSKIKAIKDILNRKE